MIPSRRLAIATAALTFALATTAFAQEPTPTPAPAPAPTPAPPAAPSSEPTAEQKEQARLHFSAGVNLLKDPEKARYEEAYAEFKQAYALVKSPSILGNIGLCALKLERDGEALEAYTRYLAEVPNLDAEERAQTERDIVTLKAQLTKVTVETKPDGAMIQDARITAKGEVRNIYGPVQGKLELGLRRGHHVIKARFPDGREAAWELEVNGGESHLFEAPPIVEKPIGPTGPAQPVFVKSRPVPPSVYIGGAATVGFGAAMIVTGALALSASSKYDEANNGSNANRAEDLRGDAQTLNIVSDVMLGLTVVGAVVTTYLYLSRPTVSTQIPASGAEVGLVNGRRTQAKTYRPSLIWRAEF